MNTTSTPFRFAHSIRHLYRAAVLDSLEIVRTQGWRELLRQRGWKFFAGIVLCYLVRDTLLYVVVPLCVARRLF